MTTKPNRSALEELRLKKEGEASFGQDLSDIRAPIGGAAGAAADALKAEAYATGNDMVFASTPTLHTAAHEAAHIVQQRGGVQLKGGVGEVGDQYERHANAVADRVIAGESAEDLLDSLAGSGGGSAVQMLTTYGGEFDNRQVRRNGYVLGNLA